MTVILKSHASNEKRRCSLSNLKQIKWILLFFIVFSSILVFANESSLCSGRLSNGLTYYIHPNLTSKKHISLDFIVRAGSANELESERGFSHLIEHLIVNEMRFKGVKINDDYCPIWDLSYPVVSELTSYEFTQYHLDISLGIVDGLEEGLKTFSSILTTFPISHQNFVESKREILEEISEIYNSPTQKWQHTRIGYEYPPYKNKHPLGESYCISEASIEKVDNFFKKHYQPNRTAVIVVGNVHPGFVEPLIKQYFETLPYSPEIGKAVRANPLVSGECFVYFDSQLEQNELSLTKILPRMSEQESLMFSIWMHLLQQHLQTILLSLPVGFSSPRLEMLSYPNLLRLKVFLSADHYQNGILQLKEVLESFYSKPTSLQEFNTLKAQIKGAVLVQSQNDQFLSDFYRDLFINQDSHTKQPSMDENSFNAISLESFHQISKTFHGFSQASLAMNQKPKMDVSLGSLVNDSTDVRNKYGN